MKFRFSLSAFMSAMLVVCLLLVVANIANAGILRRNNGCGGGTVTAAPAATCCGAQASVSKYQTTTRIKIRTRSEYVTAPAGCGSCGSPTLTPISAPMAPMPAKVIIDCPDGKCPAPGFKIVGVTAIPPGGDGLIDRLLSLHNALRARHNRPLLVLDAELCQRAHQSAALQAQRGQVGHFLPGDPENSAKGQHSENEVVTDWTGSSGHFANMINPSYQRVGFGRVGDAWAARFGN